MKDYRTAKKKIACRGCLYNTFEEWKKADKDYCFLCDKNGSEMVEKPTKE